MKILKQGTEYEGWNLEVTCTGNGNGGGGCGSLLLVNVGDIYETSSTDLSGSTDRYQTFCCPVCGIETDIPWSTRVPRLLGTRPSAAERERRLRGRYRSPPHEGP